MRLRLRENSLFAILLRSAWWYSLLIGAAIVGLAYALLSPHYAIYGMVMSIPFFGLAVIAFYRQMGQPTARKTAATAEWIRTSRARVLTRALTAAYSEAGYRIRPHGGNAADLQLERDGRGTLVSCKRAKASTTGIEPLRALAAAGEQEGAGALVLVALGELTSEARSFAEENHIEILASEHLAALIGRHVGGRD